MGNLGRAIERQRGLSGDDLADWLRRADIPDFGENVPPRLPRRGLDDDDDNGGAGNIIFVQLRSEPRFPGD